jgi:CheY-like chemotaxis protein
MNGDILIVDDSKTMRELLRLHLSDAGYTVVQAEDALQAGRILLEKHFDLVICDIDMPYMTGIELVIALKADRTVPDTPVVFLSSNVDASTGMKAGAVRYLVKPVTKDKLLEAVATHLKRRS